MKNTKSLKIAVSLGLVSILLVLISLAVAQQNPPQGQPAPGIGAAAVARAQRLGQANQALGADQGQRFWRILNRPEVQKALVITDDQRKKLEDAAFNFRKSAIQQRAALQVQRLELQRLMEADTPDRAAIDKKVAEISQTQSILLKASINGLMDARAILTKEQRDRIRVYLQQPAPQAALQANQNVLPRIQQLQQRLDQLQQRLQNAGRGLAGPAVPQAPQPAQPPNPPRQ